MRLRLYVSLLAAGLMSFGYFAKPAAADDFNKAITFHFSYPVEVPGQILVPGAYVFQLAEPRPPVYSLTAVQIFSKDLKGREYLVDTAMAIPAYYKESEAQPTKLPEKPIIIYEERPGNAPQAVGKWFYPGQGRGWQFVYPKRERLASYVPKAPIPMAEASAAPYAEWDRAGEEFPAPMVEWDRAPVTEGPAKEAQPAVPATVAAVQPEPEPVAIAQNLPAAPLRIFDLKIEPNASREAIHELPKTASDFPLAAVLGLLLLGSGGAVLGLHRS